MQNDQRDQQASRTRGDEAPSRPQRSGVATMISRQKLVVSPEKLANLSGKTQDVSRVEPAGLTLTVQVVDVPPGGSVPKHHHGGPTINYMLSGALTMQLLGGPAVVYQPGQTLFEPPGSVHLYAENLSLTEPEKVMLIHVHDEAAQLVVFH